MSLRACQRCHQVRQLRGRLCSTCYSRKNYGYAPLYQGPCLWEGCASRGRGRSGYCRRHYDRTFDRWQRQKKALRVLVGLPDVTVEYLLLAVQHLRAPSAEVEEARRAIEKVLEALRDRRALLVLRHGMSIATPCRSVGA